MSDSCHSQERAKADDIIRVKNGHNLRQALAPCESLPPFFLKSLTRWPARPNFEDPFGACPNERTETQMQFEEWRFRAFSHRPQCSDRRAGEGQNDKNSTCNITKTSPPQSQWIILQTQITKKKKHHRVIKELSVTGEIHLELNGRETVQTLTWRKGGTSSATSRDIV